ncbi:hypothetical protein D3C84_997360 [compost metagenome]
MILIVAGLGAVIELLQQDDVRLFGADHPGGFVEVVGQVLRGGAFILAATVVQVVPEHITLACQVLDVPGHHLERLARHEQRRLAATGDGNCFALFRVPGEVPGQQPERNGEKQEYQQGNAQ